MTTETLRRPESEIIDGIINTPLGRQMASRWNWSRPQFEACLKFAADLKAAIQADRRSGAPRVTRLKEEYRRSFGANDADLLVLKHVDQHWQSEGFAFSREVAQQAKDAEYVAMILVNEVA